MSSVNGKCPPGPKGSFFSGNLSGFSQDPLGFLTGCANKYGDVVKISKYTYLVNHPDLVKRVLQNKEGGLEKYDKENASNNRSSFPNSVMNCSGSDWQKKRIHLQPAFAKSLIHNNLKPSSSLVFEYINRSLVNTPTPIDLRQSLGGLCMDIGGRFLFDDEMSPDESKQIVDVVELIIALTRSQIWFPEFIPTPRNLRLQKAKRELDLKVNQIVERFKNKPSKNTCLLSQLLNADMSNNTRWLKDEFATMIMSGLEPLADGLTWAFFLLAKNPKAERKLCDEISGFFNKHTAIDGSNISELAYTEAVVKETLRLYPPAWMTGRIATHNLTIGDDYFVNKGTMIAVSQWVSHRDSRFYQDPSEFIPERWLDPAFKSQLSPYSYFPFGAGGRQCIANAFVVSHMSLIIALLLNSIQINLLPDAAVTAYPALVLRPLGVRVTIKSR